MITERVKRPVWRNGCVVVFTRMRYGPAWGKRAATRASQPRPLCKSPSFTPGPSTIRYGSNSSEERSTVYLLPGTAVRVHVWM